MWVCGMCGFCNVCVCVGFVMCLCNMYTVFWLRFLLTWLKFLLPWLVFPCFFLSCRANARVKLAKTGHGPHSSTLFVIWVVRLLFVLFCVLFVCKCVLPPCDNPIAVNKYIKKLSQHFLYLTRNSLLQFPPVQYCYVNDRWWSGLPVWSNEGHTQPLLTLLGVYMKYIKWNGIK
jgi:hypothetical protein